MAGAIHIYLGNSISKRFLGSLNEFQQGSFTAQNINDIQIHFQKPDSRFAANYLSLHKN